jgi:PAS domain S-box-containing protein
MSEHRRSAAGALRVLLLGTIVLPALIFIAAAWLGYRSTFEGAEQELARTAEVAREHAAKVFDSHRLVAARVTDLLHGLTDSAILRSQEILHEQLKQLIVGLPQVQSIRMIDRGGRLLLATDLMPVPRDVDLSDSEFFLVARDRPQPIHISRTIKGKILGRLFFGVVQRRESPDGNFNGLVLITVSPQFFLGFYATLADAPGDLVALIREDGEMLVRGPVMVEPAARLPEDSPFFRAVALAPERGVYVSDSALDQVRRLCAYTRLEQYPVFAVMGRPIAAIVATWRERMLSYLVYGLPATLCLVAVSLIALRRTESEAAALGQARDEIAARQAAETDRQAASRALEEANARLELTVSERTAHLREANEEIKRTLDLLSNILKSMADAVIVTDGFGRIIHSNPAALNLFGTIAEVGAPAWEQAFRAGESEEARAEHPEQGPIRQAIRGEPVDDLELVMPSEHGDGDVHLIVNARPLCDPDGRVDGAVAVYRDMTAMKETENQLRQSQKMEALGQVTGGFAHDFNNILTVITGTIEILAQGVSDRPKLAAIAAMIDDAAERGGDLTQRLLAFARKQPLKPREIDINALIAEGERLLKPALGAQVEIETILAVDAGPALVDPGQLITALLNLAVNARDAMPAGGQLTIETRNVEIDASYAEAHGEVAPGQYVLIAVSDTGRGIPPGLLQKVFEPFFTTKEPGKGTGLGLSMVYGFVKQSGGHIEIYSEERLGTTVKIYLPRTRRPEATAHEADPDPIPEGNEAILVVEDDALVRRYVTAQLASLGYATRAAQNAAEALGIIEGEEPFDLLFTDIVMPGGMNGRVLAEEAVRRRPSLHVLFTSGYTENAIVHHGHLDPGVLLLSKPYRKHDLARMVRLALARPYRAA